MGDAVHLNTDIKFGPEVEALLKSYSGVSVADYDTVLIVAHLVKTQLSQIVSKCSHFAELRRSRVLELEDVLFMLAKDEPKFPRIVKHLIFKDKQAKLKVPSNFSASEASELGNPTEASGFTSPGSSGSHIQQNGNRVNTIKRFLDTYHVSKEIRTCCFSSQLDCVKRLRLQREERLSGFMSAAQYVQWNQAKTESA
ncbi:uncharacterized protein LOC142337068 isoform X2 [Convolutriloba macropyga]|uniref:uncharacterized protein LOC142337068 isoform X2 n=1 Tax=Convolutriloba macropyga TaxID=536237 RepID=UPI003F51EDA6